MQPDCTRAAPGLHSPIATVGGAVFHDLREGRLPIMTSVPFLARRLAAGATVGVLSTMLAAVPAHAEAVSARYIVVLKDGAAAAAASIDSVGVVAERYESIPAFTATMTGAQARRLAADPHVALVEPDRKIGIDATQTNPGWGLDRIDQRSGSLSHTFTPTDDGSSVHAYVIDTGIRITHKQFGGRASYGYDYVDGDRTAGDCNGHGTHVAGTIGGSTYGVAKKAKLVAVRVLDCDGQGWISDIIKGVDWVTRHAIRPAVANMSLGGDPSPALNRAVAASIKSGVTYSVAAGNSAENAVNESPANLGSAITVGATDWFDERASFSNYGSLVDIFAPGVYVTSAWYSSNTATKAESGTSMASPHVAGAAALVLDAHPKWSPAAVRDYLVDHSTKGTLTGIGPGSPNRLLYTVAPPARAAIRTASLKTGKSGRAYKAQLALKASRQGTWKVVGGKLPKGLRLSSSGVISGKPRGAAVRRVTVGFTDYVPRSVTRTLTIRVRR
jgi:subtilisin family serine protease